jgi:site-specific DNA-cytosine methylase
MTFLPCTIDDDRRRGPSVNTEVTPTLTGRMGTGGNNMPMTFVKAKRAQTVEDDETWEPNRPAPTLNQFDNNHETRATVLTVFGMSQHAGYTEGVTTLTATDHKRPEQNIATVLTVFGWQENQLAGNYRDDGSTETLTTTKTQAVFIPAAPQTVVYPVAERTREGGTTLELGEAELANVLKIGGTQQHVLAPQQATNFDEYNFTGGQQVHHSIRAGTQQSTGVVLAPSLTASNDPSRSPQSSEVTQQVEAVRRAASAVRRLTPVECERLMGWPDNWTQTTADGKQQADSHRYRQCGNGVVANVAEWIGFRLHDAQQVNP